MINACQDVSANWDLTSDSLALYLAEQLNTEHVMLLKSLSLNNLNARQLSESGMVDKDFPEFVKKSESTIWWLDQSDMGTLEELLKINKKPEGLLNAIEY